MPAIALTEHGNVSSHVPFWEACQSTDVKAIFGCEFYTMPGASEEKRSRHKGHLTVLAKSQQGYTNLMKLVSRSYAEGFYYKASITPEFFANGNTGGLVVLSGCASSRLAQLALGDNRDLYYQHIELYQRAFPDFYLEIQALDYDQSVLVNQAHAKASRDLGVPCVITTDVHYTEPKQHEVMQMLHCIRDRQTWTEHSKISTPLHMKTDRELAAILKQHGLDNSFLAQAAENTRTIAAMCNVVLPALQPMSMTDSQEKFTEACWKGLADRELTGDRYVKRLEYEMSIIQSRPGFVEYFLLVSELVSWAKSQSILTGPARGSAAGSLVCYCLNITEVDPIRHGLMFERFLDITRTDLPDIDIDFEDHKRDLVKRHLSEKYGHVGNLGAFSTFKGHNSILETAKIFQIPAAEANVLKRLIIQRSGADARASMTITDTIETFPEARAVAKKYPELLRAVNLEGKLRHMTTHAAGVAIASDTLEHVCADYKDRISVDGDMCSKLGLLKLDLLGLKVLSVLKDLIDITGLSMQDLYRLELEEPKVYDVFRQGKLTGIFQFDGFALRTVTNQVKPTCFHDIVLITALARPGPLHCGATGQLVTLRTSGADPEPFHPIYDEVTKDTYGQIVFQEQVMAISRQIGKMSWEDVSALRTGMSKSKGQEWFDQYRQKFVAGGMQSGISTELLDRLWNNMCTFGSWAFALSHAASYALISYWTMWFKVFYPTEFYWASLKHEWEDKSVEALLREFMLAGGMYLSPKVNKSGATWAIEAPMVLRAPYTLITGVGEKTAQGIIARHPIVSLEDAKKRLTKKMFELLEKNGCLNPVRNTDFLGVHARFAALRSIKNRALIGPIQPTGQYRTITIGGTIKERNLRDIREVAASKRRFYNPETGQVEEREMIIEDPHLAQFVNFFVEDETGSMTASIDRYLYPKLGPKFWAIPEGALVRVTGKLPSNFKKLIVKEISLV